MGVEDSQVNNRSRTSSTSLLFRTDSTCRGTTQRGQRCRNSGTRNGYCHYHVDQDGPPPYLRISPNDRNSNTNHEIPPLADPERTRLEGEIRRLRVQCENLTREKDALERREVEMTATALQEELGLDRLRSQTARDIQTLKQEIEAEKAKRHESERIRLRLEREVQLLRDETERKRAETQQKIESTEKKLRESMKKQLDQLLHQAMAQMTQDFEEKLRQAKARLVAELSAHPPPRQHEQQGSRSNTETNASGSIPKQAEGPQRNGHAKETRSQTEDSDLDSRLHSLSGDARSRRAAFAAQQRKAHPVGNDYPHVLWTHRLAINNFLEQMEKFQKIRHMDLKNDSSSTPGSTFKAIPWPILKPHPTYITVEDVTSRRIKHFFNAAAKNLGESSWNDLLRKTQIRFHPDKWSSLLATLGDPLERECLQHVVQEVSQTVNELASLVN